MRPAKLICPYARYNRDMNLDCTKTGNLCAHQRWCAGKGWAVLTDQAVACPAGKDDGNAKRKTGKKRRG